MCKIVLPLPLFAAWGWGMAVDIRMSRPMTFIVTFPWLAVPPLVLGHTPLLLSFLTGWLSPTLYLSFHPSLLLQMPLTFALAHTI